MSAMSRRSPLIALVASIALVAGLAATWEPVSEGNRTQRLDRCVRGDRAGATARP
jgi:hypothetical protein